MNLIVKLRLLSLLQLTFRQNNFFSVTWLYVGFTYSQVMTLKNFISIRVFSLADAQALHKQGVLIIGKTRLHSQSYGHEYIFFGFSKDLKIVLLRGQNQELDFYNERMFKRMRFNTAEAPHFDAKERDQIP